MTGAVSSKKNPQVITNPPVSPVLETHTSGPAQVVCVFDENILQRVAHKATNAAENLLKKASLYIPKSVKEFCQDPISTNTLNEITKNVMGITESWGKRTPIKFCTPLEYLDTGSIALARRLWTTAYQLRIVFDSKNVFATNVETLAKKLTFKKSAGIEASSTDKIKEMTEKKYEEHVLKHLRTNLVANLTGNAIRDFSNHTITWIERSGIIYFFPFVWNISSWSPWPYWTFAAVSFCFWSYPLHSKMSQKLSKAPTCANPLLPSEKYITELKKYIIDETKKNSFQKRFRFIQSF